MFNLGLDFGSTYTTVSIYREETKNLESIVMSQSSPFVPTVLAEYKGKIEYGRAGKKLTGKKDAKVYKGFKMLIPERDAKILLKRGYDEVNTPVAVSEKFIDRILTEVMNDCHEECIDNIVVGVPEIWNDGMKTIDGRTIVRDILRRLDYVKNIQVVSEPAAASAFFSYNFQMCTGKCFEGKMLLIDYGGGTLDITLTDVATRRNKRDEDSVEIKVLDRTGAGENEDGVIGKAGIVYMESVAMEAINQCDSIDEENFIKDGKFFKIVDVLEEELQDRVNIVEEIFDEYGTDYPEDLEDEEFTTLEYKGEDVPVTFRMLLDVYNRIIYPVLNEKLDECITYMINHDINYMERNEDNFKIALVGGFSNFYLVKKQIKDKFKFSEFDKRQENIILNRADCEKAISLGTALLAAGVIDIRNTAAYSIGVAVKTIDGQVARDYAIKYHQDIEFNKPYFAKDKDGNENLIFSSSGGVSQFIINMKEDDNVAIIVPIKDQLKDRLTNIIQNETMVVAIGFSVDSSGVLSIHVHDYDFATGTLSDKGQTIELSRFNDLFEVTKVERVM